MPKLTFDDVTNFHKKGLLEEAKLGYLALLRETPDNAILLNQLALVFAEVGDLDSAQDYIEKALFIEPKEPVFNLHLANILKAKGMYNKAQQVLLDLIAREPNYAPAYNNLGSVYYARAKLELAEQTFKSALEKDASYEDVYYNLALVLTKLNKREEALNTYKALLEIAPQNVAAKFQLGKLLMELGRYPDAIKQFLEVKITHPFHLETETNLATCYLRQGLLKEALEHYHKALDFEPNDLQILFNLGVISTQIGHPDKAVHYYLRALKVNPKDIATHNNLAIVYLGLKNKAEALKHFEIALSLRPADLALKHIVNTLRQAKNITETPVEYVRSLFDAYAKHYDAHLTQTLGYVVPNELYRIVNETKTLQTASLDVLDLGCGTGLCGAIFRSAAKTLTGVDVSDEMLAIASQKNIYDTLVRADILTFLHKSADGAVKYDLILAADVFEYFGDLEELIRAITHVLQPQGLLAFNIEVSEGAGEGIGEGQENYQLTGSGRFAHSKSYIEACAYKNQLELMMAKEAFMRKQEQTKVFGMYYVFTVV